MEDVDDARELVEQRMRAAGMEESIFDRIIDLLERFDTDREKLFEEMLDKLEASGYDGLRDRWSTNCERARSLLEDLEENMVDVLEDSQADARSATERMAAVGPVDFLAGERRIWAQVAKGDVPDAATLMAKVLEADLAVIKKCEEDLKKVREDDKVVEALIVRNFGSITASVKDLVAKYSVTALPRLMVLLMKDPSAKEAATELIRTIEKLAEENYQAAKQKRVAKQVLLDNIKLLTDAREQLDEAWIDKLFDRGEEAASGWRGIGRNGSYEATDWDGFKNACVEALDTRSEAAKEQSRKIYGELLPTFVEESTKAFAALTDDPATLERFTSELKASFESLDDLLEREKEYQQELVDGAGKQAAGETLATVWTSVKASWELVSSRTRDANDEVKR
ncbi:hypothetical protein [Micromonospora humi]|uniref:Uncharacterized protein n=1 Tax=Micromonospora humi TaxID=745366 RepID=A0A1C5JD28_9ACTN|nr:hypothetical protein [Micromonospora humi]SCG68109.1 hypothetical protein GA0070213_11057 [Micromonospora humi]